MNGKTRSISDLSVASTVSILDAMQKMDAVRRKLLMVVEDGRLVGLLSIGAVQRAIVRGIGPKEPISAILRKDPIVCTANDPEEKIKGEMLKHRAEYMPVVEGDRVVNLMFWEDLFGEGMSDGVEKKYDLPVVVMAGGTGSRLKPLTNILPKPLLPIGKETIVEAIMDSFTAIGCRRFFVSLNYKADMIEQYLTEANKGQYELTFFREDRPLGTGGSLSLLKDRLQEPFFVTNCDNILQQDISDIVECHRSNGNEMTVVAAVKNLKLPYGNLVTGAGEQVVRIEEKPEFVFRVNTGVYILEPGLLKEIPDNTYYLITDLVETIVKRSGRVGCFPITDGSWCDIGNWDDYRKAIGQ